MDLYSIYQTGKNAYAKLSRALPNGYALPPMNLVIELTYRCNLNCEMCYQRVQERTFDTKPGQFKDELTFEQIIKTIDQTPPYCVIIFSGGEPFIRKDLIDILIYAAKKRKCHIVSNAALINPETAKKLVDIGLLSVGISIDGDRETHDAIRGIPGTFDRMIENVRLIREYRDSKGRKSPVINLKTVISKHNAEKLEEIYRIGKMAGADYCTYQIENMSLELSALRLHEDFAPYQAAPAPVEDIDGLNGILTALNRLSDGKPNMRYIPGFSQQDIVAHYSGNLAIEDFTCQAPWIGMNISPYGEVFPCFNYAIGNVKETSLMTMWNNQRFRFFRSTLKQDGLFKGCVGCCDLERRG